MKLWSQPVRSDEEGVALITAMFSVLVLAMFAVLFVANATSSSRQSGIERHRENSIHAAEAAADHLITFINADTPADPTDTSQGENFVVPTIGAVPSGGQDAEVAWVLAETEAAVDDDPSVLVTTGFGQGYAIRPANPAAPGTALDVVYAAGFSPNYEAWASDARNSRARVIKMQITTGFGAPSDAILTCGDLTLGGSAATHGIAGNVYVHGDVHSIGNSFSIDGDLSATGNIPNDVDDNVIGVVNRAAPDKGCTDFSARRFYNLGRNTPGYDGFVGAEPDLDASDTRQSPPYYGTDADGAPIYWYDLCPPNSGPSGDVRPRAHIRTPNPLLSGEGASDPGEGPCTGAVVEWEDGQAGDSKGWEYRNGRWAGNAVQPGIYYVYQRNVRVNGGAGGVTVILEATHTGTDHDQADQQGPANGSLDIQGNPKFEAAIWDLQFAIERDFEMNGTPGTELSGAILIWEQFGASGNATMDGTIVAQERASTTGSPITDGGSAVTGSMGITNNADIRIPVHDLTRVTFWNEIATR